MSISPFVFTENEFYKHINSQPDVAYISIKAEVIGAFWGTIFSCGIILSALAIYGKLIVIVSFAVPISVITRKRASFWTTIEVYGKRNETHWALITQSVLVSWIDSLLVLAS